MAHHTSPCGCKRGSAQVPGLMLRPGHCLSNCRVPDLWGINSKLPVPPGPFLQTRTFSLTVTLHLMSPQDAPKTSLLSQPGGGSHPEGYTFADLRLLAASTVGPPEILRAGICRQGALRKPCPRSRCGRATRKVREWESQVRGWGIRSVSAIPELARRPLAARAAQPSSLPHFPGATRWALQGRPSLELVSAAPVSPDF